MVMVLAFQMLFLLLVSCHFAAAQTVALDSSVGLRQACPFEMVTFTCTVTQGFRLDWIVEPFIPDGDPLQFTSTTPISTSRDCNDVTPPQCDNIDFVANLTNTANPNVVSGTTLADITSTLTFNATASLDGTVVQCRGGTADGFPVTNTTLNVAGLPSPPRSPSSIVQQYGQDNVNLTVQWQPSLDDGGAPVNYTITVSPGVSTVLTSGTSVPVTVPYNVNHTVSIVATNCNGSSSAAMESIRIANCSDPPVPRNGSIDPYQNTTEGAQIVFQCDPELVPAGNMTAVCAVNGSWAPDPAATMCTSSTGVKIHLPFLTFVLAAIGVLALAEEE